jgi:hypothetical protein
MRSNLLDSICKQYYIPRIVLRHVQVSKTEARLEVIDGQQRINTINMFYDGEFSLPETLRSIDPDNVLVNRKYAELEVKQREWFDKTLFLDADIIMNIDDPLNSGHLRKAAEIFWRLQQGQPLTFMETLHSRLYSGVRNFVAKYADDITYDFTNYNFVESNPDQHAFFKRVLDMSNDRMQHLALLARMLLIEAADGPTDLRNETIQAFVERFPIHNLKDTSFENTPEARSCLHILNTFYEIFKDDPMIDDQNGVKELGREYFVISAYLLLRHLANHYVFAKKEHLIFKDFVVEFHKRWLDRRATDLDMLKFREYRQQDKDSVEVRDALIRDAFFEKSGALLLKDGKRFFDEGERISIYRKANGICEMCIDEGKSEAQATVSWKDFEAHHILPWILGGQTKVEKGKLLCQRHNLELGSNT